MRTLGQMHATGLQRFAQRFQDLRVEFGEFIQKQDSAMGKTDLARPWWRAAAT